MCARAHLPRSTWQSLLRGVDHMESSESGEMDRQSSTPPVGHALLISIWQSFATTQ